MQKNVGDRDSVIRMMAGIGALLIAAGLMQWVLASIAFIILAMLLLYTALTEWCPLYTWLGINTRERHGGTHGGTAGPRSA
jgi:hypothetical protein